MMSELKADRKMVPYEAALASIWLSAASKDKAPDFYSDGVTWQCTICHLREVTFNLFRC